MGLYEIEWSLAASGKYLVETTSPEAAEKSKSYFSHIPLFENASEFTWKAKTVK